ncbi:MAG: hypothetical protein Q8L48_10290 [Archangium sp.]|nr:hypothetical protein [Archangium sp.]
MRRLWLCTIITFAACPPAGDPSLEIIVSPNQLDALGRTSKVRVVATHGDGTIGTGSLNLEVSPGELDHTSFGLDAFGTAVTTLTCVSGDPSCVEGASLSLSARWTQTDGGIVRGTRSVSIGMVGVGTQGSGWTVASCPPEAKLVYLFTDATTLFSFHPPTKALLPLGKLQCPVAASAQPNSMAVSQDAVAWVSYSDGSLFRVNLRTLACTATTFTPPAGWSRYGMGFTPESSTSPVETLFIASELGLARVDLAAMRATTVGSFSGAFAGRGAELTGNSEGDLFGFFLPSAGAMQLALVDKRSAQTTQLKDFPGLNVSQTSFAYAFSSWGSDFYLYTSSDNAPTTVTKYEPGGGSITTHLVAPSGVRVLGAGVSRCGGD